MVPHAGTGWGAGGSVVGKALPCNAIPDAFKYQQHFPQDTAPKVQPDPTLKLNSTVQPEKFEQRPSIFCEHHCTGVVL